MTSAYGGDPDIDRLMGLLDSSSSPYKFEDEYDGGGNGSGGGGGGGGGEYGYGNVDRGESPGQGGGGRGDDGYGEDEQKSGPSKPSSSYARGYGEERGMDMKPSMEYNAFGSSGDLNEPRQPARVSLHRGKSTAPRLLPSGNESSAISSAPAYRTQDLRNSGPSAPASYHSKKLLEDDLEDLGGPQPPPGAIMGSSRFPLDKSDPLGEYDGVQEALDARDAELEAVEEQVATVDVIRAREQKEFPADYGQKSLVPITALDPNHTPLFNFPTFNRMQSKVFADIYGGDENIVVTAPTSSGKTAIFELAYLRMRKENPGRLAIYMAPTKALCSERARDWKHRFDKVGTCVEITGDTNTVGLDRLLATATLLVITPEKLDVLSRRVAKYTSLENLRLVMIDEVHILGESRGATLEVVMSRLKKRCTSYEPIRFVAVSATVPNIRDVARWLAPPRSQATPGVFINGANEETVTGNSEDRLQLKTMPEAKLWQFGEDYRPVPLTKVVNGYDGSDWTLGKKLDQELMPLIIEHGAGKPILVFCPTRRACQATAAFLHERFQELCASGGSRRPLPWPKSREAASFNDPQLQLWWTSGIAVHHAGIENTDRRAIEDGYRSGAISVICCTSTLAVGVNLPAHLVIIKGTQTWAGAANGMREYSDVDIQQMMGRAGRPQYDNSGTVIIMCEKSKVGMYRQKIFSQTVLESCLHTNLSEHINSEVGLGTINSLKSAQDWLEGSFLWIRIQQNPSAYTSIKKTMKGSNETWDKVLEKYVKLGLQQLRSIELVTHKGWSMEMKKTGTMSDDDPMEDLQHTALGKIMSECCIQLGTMESIVELGPKADLQDCLETLSGACEFEDLRVRQGEAGFLNQLRASPEIRFPLEDPVKTYADKVYLLLQGRFAAIEWDSVKGKTKTENSSCQQTLFTIYQSAPRIAQGKRPVWSVLTIAIARVMTTRNYGSASKAGLELLRIVNGKAWENQASIFQQLRNIGPKSMKVLGANNVLTWQDLLKTPPAQLEHWLARNPPFGSNLIREALAKDRYEVTMRQTAATLDQDGFPSITFTINLKNEKKGVDEKDVSKYIRRNNLSILTIRSDGDWIDYRRALAKKMVKTEFELKAELSAPDQTIIIEAGVDETSGLTTRATLHPDLSQLDDVDYAACEERRLAREKKEAKERRRAAKEAEGGMVIERDLDAEEMKKRDKSVRNRKVRPEDFRKEEAHEGGWERPKSMPKKLDLPLDEADVMEVDAGAVSDEAMEDNEFDDGQGRPKARAEKSARVKPSSSYKARERTGSSYIDGEAEESDVDSLNIRPGKSTSHRDYEHPTRSSLFIDDEAEESSDGGIEALDAHPVSSSINKRKKHSNKRPQDEIDSDDSLVMDSRKAPKLTQPKRSTAPTARSPRAASSPVGIKDLQPARADTLVDQSHPSSQLTLVGIKQPLSAPMQPVEQQDPEPESDDWFGDGADLSSFIIIPDEPKPRPNNQLARSPDLRHPTLSSIPSPAKRSTAALAPRRTPKGPVRFDSQEYIQDHFDHVDERDRNGVGAGEYHEQVGSEQEVVYEGGEEVDMYMDMEQGGQLYDGQSDNIYYDTSASQNEYSQDRNYDFTNMHMQQPYQQGDASASAFYGDYDNTNDEMPFQSRSEMEQPRAPIHRQGFATLSSGDIGPESHAYVQTF